MQHCDSDGTDSNVTVLTVTALRQSCYNDVHIDVRATATDVVTLL